MDRRTHIYAPSFPARVVGWRRSWRQSPVRRVAFLTVQPDPGTVLDGLVAAVPQGDWAALDAREASYDRVDTTLQVDPLPERAAQVAIYTVPHERAAPAGADHPILLSYLDVVLGGYLDQFDAAGAERFFETTDGWEAPVLDDRAAPLYPRSQPLSEMVRHWVDGALARRGVEVTK
ncbi:gamma-glutamylcyclotransferase family protein [Litorisediminicola beolgyonensis]|uniref:Gamma-glutamylcyclotransferase family protein n=1 Tax=Litorisediminicola beolgyonensis TaxID=1173614 RepID=A0ABW3ZEW4_9RHOB